MVMRRLAVVAGTAALVAAVSGCGSSSDSSSAAAGGAGGGSGNAIAIQNFAFMPNSTTVKVGTTVTWTNQDSSTHTAKADSGDPDMFDTGNLSQGKSGTFTFQKAGTYKYHCDIHQYMTATITVTA